VKKPLGRPRHRWQDDIIIDLKGNVGNVWTGCIWLRIETRMENIKNAYNILLVNLK
jgi:hypothetical protein